ncbi:MAG: DUF1345 domain-containing protein [Hyphomonadaceae bacterium]|nr:DUF1345 domain-containing protein [Hyphomonadaceae bacterium]
MAWLRAFWRHTPLMLALSVGVGLHVALSLSGHDFADLTRMLIAWDAAIAIYLIAIWRQTRNITSQHMIEHAAQADEGRYFVLFVSIAGVLASLTAIILELQSKLEPGMTRNAHAAFVFATVALSWLFVHTSFAKHYAHEFYGPADGGGIRKGLVFPGGDDPDFADFFHFAIVIGVASQTADIQISAKPIRRIVTLHGVLAFLFNTVILALAINVAAGLFS